MVGSQSGSTPGLSACTAPTSSIQPNCHANRDAVVDIILAASERAFRTFRTEEDLKAMENIRLPLESCVS